MRRPAFGSWILFTTLLIGGVVGADDIRWHENFAAWPSTWSSPRQSPEEIRQVFQLGSDASGTFLRAVHDSRPGRDVPPAVHFGHAFTRNKLRLSTACHLTFRWRVNQHPAPSADPWEDLAASVYVIIENPGLFGRGKGFKLGWLSRSGPEGTHQRGIVQIPVRHDPAGRSFRSESFNLCDLYQEHFGQVTDEELLYLGVMTDSDGSKSRAAADYTDFRLSSF